MSSPQTWRIPLYILNLPDDITEEQLRAVFHSHTSVKVRANALGSRYAHIEMPLDIAIQELGHRKMIYKTPTYPQESVLQLSSSRDRQTTSIDIRALSASGLLEHLPHELRAFLDCLQLQVYLHQTERDEGRLRLHDSRMQLEAQIDLNSMLRGQLVELRKMTTDLRNERDEAIERLGRQEDTLQGNVKEIQDLRAEKSWRDAARKEEARLRHRDVESWRATTKEWTSDTAVERAAAVLKEFSQARFTRNHPMTFSSIPWPVLTDVQRLRPADMVSDTDSWEMVDKFFGYVKQKDANRCRELCNEMRKAFHPDRWRGRKMLETVFDKDERALLQIGGNRVAQVVNRQMADIKY